MRFWWAVAVAVVASPAAAADQFDLVCTAGKSGAHYRVDLVAGAWCADVCSVINKIAQVTPGILTLVDRRAIYQGDWEDRTTINRQSGAWDSYSFHPALDTVPFRRSGLCEPTQFSGLHAPKF